MAQKNRTSYNQEWHIMCVVLAVSVRSIQNRSSGWLGWKDSNLRVPESKSGALTNLATAHHLKDKIIHLSLKVASHFSVFNKTVSFLYQNSNKVKKQLLTRDAIDNYAAQL